jgi:hypothetical protein
MQSLRPIALTVVEEEQGVYRWRLIERSASGEWQVLNQQSRSAMTYRKAMADGLLELQGMIDNLDDGPREEEPPAAPAKKRGRAFGFGFGLH